MKKTLVAAITSALVIGAASTTFAAANPFSDVPTDHWSFDAVAKLAHEGVIEGYGDGTFRGDAKITRYEMAQMVAKAMAKEGVSSANKATIDKLSAEYADELNNLGVRVSALEKKTDNVKFNGLLRLDGSHKETDNVDNGSAVTAKVRLDMTATVNDDWAVKARFDSDADLDNDNLSSKDRKTEVKRVYAEGPLFGATAKLGKFGGFDNAGYTNGGLLLDNPVEGAEFAWKGNALTTTVTLGRLAQSDYDFTSNAAKAAKKADDAGVARPDGAGYYGTSDYAAIQFDYKATDKLKIGAGYHHLKNDSAFGSDEDTNNIWNLGFDYKLNKTLTFGALYAASDIDAEDSDIEESYGAQLTYKGVKQSAPGSFGMWLAYRQIGEAASFHPTYDGVGYGEKGVEFGAQYMLDKNIMAYVNYFDGEQVDGDKDVEKIFGRLQFSF
ncbi:S-layer homology domain-containing protein [Anaerosinus massiliensis]|uniref:S-layer homology domain-containing protein n=1 Tax=Massilibacillus massiliensis TaxID=1806837 RepID=UPI000A6F02E8|nr:S-layer homology domain-containing protein [Massilibacillus massiliensis]